MAETFEDLKREVEGFKNTLVLSDLGVVERLVGVERDESDWYYVLDTLKEHSPGVLPPLRYWATAVGRVIFLKGRLPDADYQKLLRSFNSTVKLFELDKRLGWELAV